MTADINVTPMIDVMLVLLIIFMIVTPLIAAGFRATLPVGANLDSDPEGDNEVVVGIDVNGQFFLDKRPITDEALLDQLTAIYSARDEDKILYFEADQGLKYGRIQEAVEIGREAGVRVLHAITKPSQTITLGEEEE
ncbi:MAG: ExbD/TolR family protein [Gemmatimonadales bacterium]